MTTETARPVGDQVTGFQPPPRPGGAPIEGRFVVLEPLDAARHADSIWQAAVGADWIWDYMGYGPFPGAEAYADWARGMAASSDPVAFALVDRASGRALGVATFLRIDPAQGVIEIGHILMTPPLQRTPAATEAVVLMIDWAFRAGYRRVEWKCDALNGPSRRAADRLGFAFEGIFRQHMIYKGRNRDTAWYAIIDRDWPALAAGAARWLDPGNFDAEGRQRLRLEEARG